MAINIARRKFVAALGSTALAWPLGARAQQPDRMRLIGVLMGFAEGDPTGQSQVAATQTIPIVFAVVADPIGNGFVTNLAHPGGNITGFTSLNSTMGGKWVELLKEIAPRTERVALLFNPATAMPFQFLMPSIQAAASSFAVQVSAAPVHTKNEIEGVIAAQARTPGGGLIVMPDVFNTRNRDLIIALAARYGVPAFYFNPHYFAESGGLIGYSDDYAEESRLAAGYIDRILKGEKPVNLPVQNPTKYQLIINLKSAKALGLSVPARRQRRFRPYLGSREGRSVDPQRGPTGPVRRGCKQGEDLGGEPQGEVNRMWGAPRAPPWGWIVSGPDQKRDDLDAILRDAGDLQGLNAAGRWRRALGGLSPNAGNEERLQHGRR